MKSSYDFPILLFLLCIAVIACRPNDINPSDASNTPSDIIIKQKDSTGVFKVIIEINLFPDSIFYDSIQYRTSSYSYTLIPNYSLFNTDKVVLTGYYGSDTMTAYALKLDSLNRITNLYPSYSVPAKEQTSNIESTDFNYLSNGKIDYYSYGKLKDYGGCNGGGTSNLFNYFTGSNGNDSIRLDISTLTCATPDNFYHDTLNMVYTNHHNNTNLLILSVPPFLPDYNVLSGLLEFLPFKGLDANLIDHLSGRLFLDISRTNVFLNVHYLYSFDRNNRVKTVTIDYSGSESPFSTFPEMQIEFNY